MMFPEIEQPPITDEMPSAVELEYGLIGAMVTNNALLDELTFLSPEHFYAPEHARMYELMIEMRAEGTLITPFSLAAQLTDSKAMISYLAKACSYSLACLRPESEAKMLVDLAERRAIITVCKEYMERLRNDRRSSAEHIADLSSALESCSSKAGRSKFMTDREVTQAILTKINSPKKPFSTGISRLDVCMEGGLYPGMMYLMAGRKKMGKTTLAGTVSCNLNKDGVRHLYIAGEMGVEQIQQRNLSRLTNTFSSSFRTDYGRTPEFQNKIAAQIEASNNCTIYLNAPGITFEELRRSVAQAISIYKIDGFILDSLQLVGGKDARKSQSEHQDEVSQWTADYARQHNIFSIVTAQINQTGNIRGGEGVRLACDMGFEIHAPEGDPSRSSRWLEMIETRYTAWLNMGDENTPGLSMNEHGPYFHEPDYGIML